MTALRVVVSPADLKTWAEVKSSVVPNEPVTAEQLVATDEEGLILEALEAALIRLKPKRMMRTRQSRCRTGSSPS